jgi:hypothetical protein
MSTNGGELAKVERPAALERVKAPDDFREVMNIAKVFVESGFFKDAPSIAQAAVKIMAGRELGFGPFASMSGIHVIKGKAEPGANLLANMVKRSGRYDYRVKRIDATACEIEFYEQGRCVGLSTFTIEDARKAETQNIGKFPRNMLFARALSNGVKWYCPDVANGIAVYSQGELEGVAELPSAEPKAVTAVAPPVTPDQPQTLQEGMAEQTSPSCSPQQAEAITALAEELKIKPAQFCDNLQAKYKTRRLSKLTQQQANDVMLELRRSLAEVLLSELNVNLDDVRLRAPIVKADLPAELAADEALAAVSVLRNMVNEAAVGAGVSETG